MSYAARLIPALTDLAGQLDAGGVRAGTDRGALQYPAAWLRVDRLGEVTLDGGGRARLSVFLITRESGDLEALKTLCGLLDLALEVLEPEEDVDTSVLVNVDNNALPAFRLVCDLDF